MSSQTDAFLTIAQNPNFTGGTVRSPNNSKIDSKAFNQWTKNCMYQSTYNRFHSRIDQPPKNSVIPGYTGFIPSIKAENMYGRGSSSLARQSLSDENIYKNMKGLATTGCNVAINKQRLIDKSKIATSNKYGKTSLQKPYPGWNGIWKTTIQDSYQNPQSRLNPTYLQNHRRLQTQGAHTKSSGFIKNNSEFDGHGWNPHPILKEDNKKTQYRDKFNGEHPFHRNAHNVKPPLLKKRA